MFPSEEGLRGGCYARSARAFAFEKRPHHERAGGGKQKRGRLRHKLESEIVHGKVYSSIEGKRSLTPKELKTRRLMPS